jgi:hypothetical protein
MRWARRSRAASVLRRGSARFSRASVCSGVFAPRSARSPVRVERRCVRLLARAASRSALSRAVCAVRCSTSCSAVSPRQKRAERSKTSSGWVTIRRGPFCKARLCWGIERRRVSSVERTGYVFARVVKLRHDARVWNSRHEDAQPLSDCASSCYDLSSTSCGVTPGVRVGARAGWRQRAWTRASPCCSRVHSPRTR